jgi:hypothetical protein
MPETTMQGRWLTYLRERSPLPLLLAIALPQTVSSYFVVHLYVPNASAWAGMAACAVGIMGLLVLLRLMDEVKDEEKDKVAHPDRPIPRGLLAAEDVRGAIATVGVVLLVYAAGLAVVFSVVMSLLFASCVVFAWLMYKEFYASAVLAESPLLYALSHQLIVVLMYLFAVGATDPTAVFSDQALWWAFGGLGASFGVELSRKLDPNAHPVLKTYLQHYGRNVVSRVMTLALALTAVAAFKLELHVLVLPFVGLTVLVTPILFLMPDKHKLIAATTGLVALIYMLAPTLLYVLAANGMRYHR